MSDSIIDKKYIVEMPDGSRWAVPVHVIAANHAAEYADEYDGNTAVSLEQGTKPLFADPDEIADWAKNSMDWADVKDFARPVEEADDIDFQDGWVNGEWSVE